MFPNKFDVYLHDTAAPELFSRAARAFSSGCIRVEKPVELAEYVLRGDPRWSRDSILAAMDQQAEQTAFLHRPIPIHLLYWTAWVDEEGMTQFRNDIYGRDSRLETALFQPPPASRPAEGPAPAETPPQEDTSFQPGRARFAVNFKEEESPYQVLGVFVLPGDTLALELKGADAPCDLRLAGGEASLLETNRWTFKAPADTGLYPLRFVHPAGRDSMLLNLFVMVPYDSLKGSYLNGYPIGRYPEIPLKQLQIYRPPRGFVEVTAENRETLVSPHFRLEQFLCKQGGKYPQYLVLRERLVLKLEFILERTNEAGYRCDTFHIMSGYRTPFYNEQIGNVRYSRHLWGGAADIFVDCDPEDGMMDDLNGDGKIDYRDAAVVYDIIDSLYGKSWYERFVGGLGRYPMTASHGPFVHVDVRGFRARWGA